MKPSNVQNFDSPTSNMYGFEPCPQCGSKYRCSFTSAPDRIDCDDCGYLEKKAEIKIK